jgi:hypothetical protein
VVKIEQKKILMNHRNETFGSGFSESGSAGFAATYCFLKKRMREKSNRGRQCGGGGTGEEGGGPTVHSPGEHSLPALFPLQKKEERKKRTSGTKGNYLI